MELRLVQQKTGCAYCACSGGTVENMLQRALPTFIAGGKKIN